MWNGRQQRPDDWFRSPLGRAVLAAEKIVLNRILAQRSGFHELVIGNWGGAHRDWLCSSRVSHRMFITRGAGGQVRARPEALPVESGSVDVIVLPHVLEYAENPHAVVREAHRVLVPEGHLLLLGFSRFSLWGLRDLFRPVAYPWGARLLAETRIGDWIRLLDMDVIAVERYFYRPPTDRPGMLRALRFLERWGQSAWPGPWPSAGYAALIRKRSLGGNVVEPDRSVRTTVFGAPATSAARTRACREHLQKEHELG